MYRDPFLLCRPM